MRKLTMIGLAALTLAGCQGANDNATTNGDAGTAIVEANQAGNSGADNALAAVLAMNDRQRNVVFIRALLDAKLPCQEVTSSTRMHDDQNGLPLWRANCSGGDSHMISITPDGTANIVSRTDR